MSQEPVIEMQGIGKVFRTEAIETRALAEIDITVNRGEYVSIVGSSGSGKSTLLGILGLLDTPSHGAYKLRGRSIAQLNDRELAEFRGAHIGFIFQTFNLIGDLSIFDNVALPLVYRNVPLGERRTKVERALARVDMSHRARHFPRQLSGGQQQRVAVARALVGDPTILLADEPTGNLDTRNGRGVMELIAELHRGGATVCVVTHDADFARMAERQLHLVDGRLA